MKPPNKMGPSVAAPSPDAIALLATAIATYPGPRLNGKRDDQWVAVPRKTVELAIDIAIDWLDLLDRLAAQAATRPENGS